MWSVLLTFLAAVFIIYLSYLCSKYIGKGMNRNGNSRYMRLIDQLMIGQDRYVAVVQVGEKYLFIAVTSGQINLLKELKEEDLFLLNPDGADGNAKTPDFKELMAKFGKLTKKER